ncbi:unnamed protein product [Durusdinium trenchii]
MGDDLEELKAENEKLKEKLRAKVWSMALATVSEMEKIAGGASHTENVTLPNRIAALERSVFGQSASSDDLERIAALETEYKQLQDDYVVLSEEHQKLQDRPPVIIKQEDNKSALLEEQLRRMQEQYQAIQQKLNKMRVEHLDLQTTHRELLEQHETLRGEAEKVEKELSTQLRVLREKHARVGQELQQLRSSSHEMSRQLQECKQEKLKLFNELQQQQEKSENMEQLRIDYESLLGSFERLQEDHEQLVEKSNRFRNTMADSWAERPKSGAGLLPPITPLTANSRCATPRSPERSFSLAEMKLSCEEFSKEVTFPSSLLEPNGPLSVSQLKTRLMEIRGTVLYCQQEADSNF